MSTQENMPAAGWYDDNTVPNQRRYWDGSEWTSKVERRMPGQFLNTKTIVFLVVLAILAAFALWAVVISMQAEADAERHVNEYMEQRRMERCMQDPSKSEEECYYGW